MNQKVINKINYSKTCDVKNGWRYSSQLGKATKTNCLKKN